MSESMFVTRMIAVFLSVLLAPLSAASAQIRGPLVPEAFEISDSVRSLLVLPFLDDDERADLRVFHGVWSDGDRANVVRDAQVLLASGQYDHPHFGDPRVPPLLRAEAAFARGALESLLQLIDDDRSLRSERLRAEALQQLGQVDEARRVVERALARAPGGSASDDPVHQTDVAALHMVRMRVAPHRPGDVRMVIGMLSRVHQDVDRLYWPALRLEAELLLEKHQRQSAAEALHQALALNPRDDGSWYLLGRLAIQIFDFDGALRAVTALQRLDRDHPLAAVLHAEARLVQDDPEQAMEVLDVVLSRFPNHRRALSLRAAAAACLYDSAALEEAMAEVERQSPGSAEAWNEVGRFLSMFRQYGPAARHLEEAIRRAPYWTTPQIELGLLEMQSGRDLRAREVLQRVIDMDPFNKRAANSLALLEELVDYETVETDHFIIRYRPGIDRVLIDLMPEPLERLHEVVAGRFRMAPSQKTVIEVMPDHERFSVRIAGMPDIHTVAACTGPVIAMEVPREGRPSQHRGLFDWERVLRHEYTHTVTLERTRNRIPHWLTEAAAVAMELAPRPYATSVMLATALEDGTLFPLDQIKWGFVRPRRPNDRSKAYAQSHWMYEFMEERFGEDAVIDLLQAYFDGLRDAEAFLSSLGVTQDEFFEEFLQWAARQVQAWGLASVPTLDDLADELRQQDPALRARLEASQKARLDAIAEAIAGSIGRPLAPGERVMRATDWPRLLRPPVEISDAQLAVWRGRHPDHPDLLELDIRRRVDEGAAADARRVESLVTDLQRLLVLRPVGEYAHRKLAEIFLAGEEYDRAVPHLEALDAREERSAVFARELTRIYRSMGDLEAAYANALRAAQIDPYRADLREIAAAIAVQRRDLASARLHIVALSVLEPDREQHRLRLERIDELKAAAQASDAGGR